MSGDADPDATVSSVVDGWRQKLLDLSRRNRLVDFRETSTTALPLASADVEALLGILVEDGAVDIFEGAADGFATENDPALCHVDGRPDLAEERLSEIARSQTAYLRERGVDTLFLSVGRLRWTPDDAAEPLESPLFLLPVGLRRRPTNRRPRLDHEIVHDGGHLVLNPALLTKLRLEREVTIPVDDLEIGALEAAFDAAIDLAGAFDGWAVSRALALAIFDFTDVAIFEDIERNRAAIEADPVVRALAGDPTGIAEEDGTNTAESTFDDRYQVLEADPTQHRAIDAALAGESFVLQGPPGTGKSQTIANVIAEKIARGEQVLFVSEKQAALEVIKRRLDDLGIGRYCLPIHGREATASAVLDALEPVMREDPVDPPREWTARTASRFDIQAKLDHYMDLLITPTEGFDVAPYEALGVLAATADLPDVDCGLDAPLELDQSHVDEAEELLSEVAVYEDPIRNRSTHPWRHLHLDRWAFDARGALERTLDRHIEALATLDRIGDELGERTPVRLERPEQIPQVKRALELLGLAPGDHWSPRLLDRAFFGDDAPVGTLAEAHVARERIESRLGERYEETILDEDGKALHRTLAAYGPSRYVRPGYYRTRRRMRAHAREGYRPGYRALLADARALRHREMLLATIAAIDVDDAYLDPFITEDGVDWAMALGVRDWVRALARNGVVDLAAADGSIGEVAFADVRRLHEALSDAEDAHARAADRLEGWVAIDEVDLDGTAYATANVHRRLAYLKHLRENLDRLQDWVQFNQRRSATGETVAGAYLEGFLAGGHDPDDLVEGFRRAFYRAWLNDLFAETALGAFNANEFEMFLGEYRRRDDAVLALGALMVRAAVSHARERPAGHLVLEREARKRRHRRSLRELFADADEEILALAPCLMMSPRAVATFLDGGMSFDAVVFDEASQIPPEKAVSAIVRAEQVIVAGDSKQLPPTRFFESDVAGIQDARVDLESVLDEAAAALPEVHLDWHYRSRHPDLVAFSNRRYYDGRLRTFPACAEGDHLGFEFVHLEDGIYDRGGTRTNPREAAAVADIVQRHVAHRPEQSLGVVAFSRAQADAIREALAERRRNDPALERYLARDDALEEFFVKSLEVVQGDERDRIVFSVGYGPDADGEVTLNFGPLNQAGGERRLNVAITRAREQVTLVSSLLPEDVDAARTDSAGVTDFVDYLRFVRGRDGRPSESVAPEVRAHTNGGDPLVDDVRARLEAAGLEVDPAPSPSGYVLDLAVSDPTAPEVSRLGIEVDGSVHANTASTRTRDRLRQAVLADRGWRVHRVWSPEWVTNPDRACDAIVERVTADADATAVGTDVSPAREDAQSDGGTDGS